MSAIAVGVDVGGTFTDVFIHDPDRQRSVALKVPSTPQNFVDGFLDGVGQALRLLGVESPSEIGRLVHGATIATNAILTKSGARVGLLMTEGFRDVLYIGLGWRPRMYDLQMDPVEPLFLAPRRRAMGVHERIGVQGDVLAPLDEGGVITAANELVREHDVQCFVVCFLHAYANPLHERRAKELLVRAYPHIPVSISSDVLPRPREYQRLVATGFDAYVKPIMNTYLEHLGSRLEAAGYRSPLQVMQSNGGVGGIEAIMQRPVKTVLSGLAAGVIGAAHVGATAGHPNCISLDMGGTSADVALIRDGKPVVTSRGSFEDWPLHLPMIEVRTIGAGGSSIAYIDEGGGLRVGPRSAGASPGPAGYGRGGLEPTVTDASLILGYLNPNTFAGGISLDVERSRAAVKKYVAEPLGIDVMEAALGIHAIVNSNMAQTLRLVSIKRGFDPRELTFIPFGGAGPVHGGVLAEEIGIPTMLIPPLPGVLSAMGLMLAPVQHDALVTYKAKAGEADFRDVAQALAPLDEACATLMSRDGESAGNCTIEYFAEMRYEGQSHDLEVPIARPVDEQSVAAAVQKFHQAHEKIYSYSNPAGAVEFTMLRTVHSGMVGESLTVFRPPGAGEQNRCTYRDVCFGSKSGFIPTPVYQRADLSGDFSVEGPAIVEQSDTTVVIYPGHTAHVDALGNLIVNVPTAVSA